MSAPDVDRYVKAAARANTRRSYESAVRHFEFEWGGFLPATSDAVARYLAEHAERLSLNTLRQRLAALSRWHLDQGHADPTRSSVVRQVLKGIRNLHPASDSRAEPLQLAQLDQVMGWLTGAAAAAVERGDDAAYLRHLRDRALVALGFWRGFRGDELLRLEVQDLRIASGEGLTLFLPRTKSDRRGAGTTFKVPALSRCCPVAASEAWVNAARLTHGPLFRAVNRWGTLAGTGLHPNSLITLLRAIFNKAGLKSPEAFSGHSLRRGFAAWANANGWDVQTLMKYIGWKDLGSAMRYIDGADRFARERIEAGLVPTPSVTAAPLALPPPEPSAADPASIMVLELVLILSPFTPRGRGVAKARRLIEETCLAPHAGVRLAADGTRYRLELEDAQSLEDTIGLLLEDLHRLADRNQCFLEASLHDAAGRSWN